MFPGGEIPASRWFRGMRNGRVLLLPAHSHGEEGAKYSKRWT